MSIRTTKHTATAATTLAMGTGVTAIVPHAAYANKATCFDPFLNKEQILTTLLFTDHFSFFTLFQLRFSLINAFTITAIAMVIPMKSTTINAITFDNCLELTSYMTL